MSDEIPECRGRYHHSWGDPELADIEWGEYHESVRVRLACNECECVIERELDVGRGYHKCSEQLVLPPLEVCEFCGESIWKEGYAYHGDYYCCSSDEVNGFICDESPEWPAFLAEQEARRAAEAKAKKEANE